jgi:hypothetical protein
MTIYYGVGVGVFVGVAVTFAVGVGVFVGVVVAPAVGFGVAVGAFVVTTRGVGVGVPVEVGVAICVGLTKIILIASSSGTGERIFLPETSIPTTRATNTKNPIITVIAASVRRRSSIALS